MIPGAAALTLGMYGCDLACPYCQNARISQVLRVTRQNYRVLDVQLMDGRCPDCGTAIAGLWAAPARAAAA